MAPAKLLVGSVVAVGSVSTAAVVANQYGVFSTSNKQKTSATPDGGATDSETDAAKIKKDEIKKWFAGDSETTDLTIKIKKKDQEPKDFKDKSITESDLEGLKDYLDSDVRKELLKSLFSALDTKTLTFEKTDNNWKHILTKADIEKWVDKTSGSKASLKAAEGNAEKTNFSEDESIAIFKAVYDNKSIFTGINGVDGGGKKTILFEKIDGNWKHSKSEIDCWLTNSEGGNNQFEIKIKKNNDDATALNSTDEGELIGLFKHLKDNKSQLSDHNTAGKKAILTLKKESGNWIVASSQTTS